MRKTPQSDTAKPRVRNSPKKKTPQQFYLLTIAGEAIAKLIVSTMSVCL